MAFRSSSSNFGGGTNPSVSVPTGVATGDIILLKCSIDASAAVFDTADWPSGFTELAEGDITHDGQSFAVAWKRTTGADSGTYSFGSLGSTNDWVVICEAFSGRHATDPPVIGTVTTNNSANSSPITTAAPGVTAVDGDDMSWTAVTDLNNGTSVPASTPPTNYTERKDTGANWSYMTSATRDNVSAGATGTVSGSYSWTSATSGWAAYLIRIPAAPAGDVSVGLTGQAATSAGGSLGPATSAALSGSALSAAQGTTVPATAKALSGQAASSASGTVIPSVAIALTGQSLSIGQGTVSAGGDIILALTGQALTLASGTLIPASSIAVSGIAMSALAGTVTPSTSKVLSGSAATSAAGTLAPATSLALAGNLLTIGQGAVSAPGNITLALTGQALTLSQGAFVPTLTKALSGSAAASAAGSVVAAPFVALSGQALTSLAGTIAASRVLSLSGSLASIGQGTISVLTAGTVENLRVTYRATFEPSRFRATTEARVFRARLNNLN